MANASHAPKFQWDDPFLLNDQLTEDERMIRDTAYLVPRSTGAAAAL